MNAIDTPTPEQLAECRARFIEVCNTHGYAHALHVMGTENKTGHALAVWQAVQCRSAARQLAASEGTHKPNREAVRAAG